MENEEATLRIADGVFTVEDTAQINWEGRPVFEWSLTLDSGESWGDNELCGPVIGPEPSEREMLGTLISFVDAALESREYGERTGREGENEHLFPTEMLDWAAPYAEEISLERAIMDEEDEEL